MTADTLDFVQQVWDYWLSAAECLCGRLLPAGWGSRAIVHHGRGGTYACSDHDREGFINIRVKRQAEYERAKEN